MSRFCGDISTVPDRSGRQTLSLTINFLCGIFLPVDRSEASCGNFTLPDDHMTSGC